MVSVIDEICASVTDVPPVNVGVVEVNRPVISFCLMNEVSARTNSRKPRGVEMRSSAETESTAMRFGLNVLDLALDVHQMILEAGGFGIFADHL